MTAEGPQQVQFTAQPTADDVIWSSAVLTRDHWANLRRFEALLTQVGLRRADENPLVRRMTALGAGIALGIGFHGVALLLMQ